MHHPVETAVGTAAALVALAFALSTWERWHAARRRHQAAWSVALALFAVAAGALAAGAQGGWDGAVFRVFYLAGAIVDVPVLALGTVYLLAGERTGDRAALLVATFAAFAAGVVVTAPFTRPLPVDELVQGSRVFGPLPRIMAALGSAAGALVIFAGAAWSAWGGWRGRRGRRSAAATRLFWSNGLIALGTLVLGGSGTLNSVFGAMTAFAVTLLIGIVVIFSGYLVATTGAGGAGRAPAIPPAEPWGGSLAGGSADDPRGADGAGGLDGASTEGPAQELPAEAVGQ